MNETSIQQLIATVILVAIVLYGLRLFAKFLIGSRTRVYEHQKGLFYRNGRVIKVVGSGSYRCSTGPFSYEEVVVSDMRERTLQVNGQEVPSADRLMVRVNIVVNYKIDDLKLATFSTENLNNSLYQYTQQAARKILNALTFDEMLTKRDELDQTLHTAIASGIRERFGTAITSAVFKDIVPPESIRRINERLVEVDKQAQAELAEARMKVASARALANAAHLIKENPTILKMQEIEVLKMAAGKSGNTFVIRVDPSEVSTTG